jgi:hypothetical protein
MYSTCWMAYCKVVKMSVSHAVNLPELNLKYILPNYKDATYTSYLDEDFSYFISVNSFSRTQYVAAKCWVWGCQQRPLLIMSFGLLLYVTGHTRVHCQQQLFSIGPQGTCLILHILTTHIAERGTVPINLMLDTIRQPVSWWRLYCKNVKISTK